MTLYESTAASLVQAQEPAGHVAFEAAKRDQITAEQVAAADDVLAYAVAHAEATR